MFGFIVIVPREDVMESVPLLDCAGRRRSPATLSSFHEGRMPRNKGLRYPADPPTVDEIIAVMRAAGDDPDGLRLRAVIVVLWRAGLRISERSPSPRAISIEPVERSSSDAARAQAPRGWHGPMGMGAD